MYAILERPVNRMIKSSSLWSACTLKMLAIFVPFFFCRATCFRAIFLDTNIRGDIRGFSECCLYLDLGLDDSAFW